MPFGLDLKSTVVGIVFALFVWPFLMQFWARLRSNGSSKSAPRTV